MVINNERKRILTPDGVIRSFDDFGVSTKTVIAITNIRVNLDHFFTYIPITDFTPIEKKRGRKKRICIETPTINLPFGTVVMIQRKREFRGIQLKTKNKRTNTYFLHSITIVLCIQNNKFVNVKISANGKFQITGCKSDDHYQQSILAILKILQDIELMTGESVYHLVDEHGNHCKYLRVIFNTVMQNVDFNLGFSICRYKLNSYINQNTEYHSIFEGSIGTGVNIKIPIHNHSDNELLRITHNLITKESIRDMVPLQAYNEMLDEKEQKKENKKPRHHTFLIFASGSVIMSSRGSDMKPTFHKLINILLTHKKYFENIESKEGFLSTKRKKKKSIKIDT
jgi:hypothetical protein